MTRYNIAAVRELLSESMNRNALLDVCFDISPTFYEDVKHASYSEIAREVVNFCVRQNETQHLLDVVQKQNKEKYKEYKELIYLDDLETLSERDKVTHAGPLQSKPLVSQRRRLYMQGLANLEDIFASSEKNSYVQQVSSAIQPWLELLGFEPNYKDMNLKIPLIMSFLTAEGHCRTEKWQLASGEFATTQRHFYALEDVNPEVPLRWFNHEAERRIRYCDGRMALNGKQWDIAVQNLEGLQDEESQQYLAYAQEQIKLDGLHRDAADFFKYGMEHGDRLSLQKASDLYAQLRESQPEDSEILRRTQDISISLKTFDEIDELMFDARTAVRSARWNRAVSFYEDIKRKEVTYRYDEVDNQVRYARKQRSLDEQFENAQLTYEQNELEEAYDILVALARQTDFYNLHKIHELLPKWKSAIVEHFITQADAAAKVFAWDEVDAICSKIDRNYPGHRDDYVTGLKNYASAQKTFDSQLSKIQLLTEKSRWKEAQETLGNLHENDDYYLVEEAKSLADQIESELAENTLTAVDFARILMVIIVLVIVVLVFRVLIINLWVNIS